MIYLYAIATFMNPDCLRLVITTISLILSVIERHTELKFELRLQLVQVLGLDNTQTNFIKSSRLTLRFRNINMAHALASPAHVRASLSDGRLNEEKKRLNYGQKSPKASMSCVNIRDIINVDKTVPPIWRWCPESLRDARRRGWQIEKMFSSAKEKHLPQKFYKICKRKVDLGHISSINLFLESKLPKDIIEMLFDDMIAQGFISLVTKFGMFTHLHQATREEIRIAGEKGYEFLLGVMERRGSRNNFVKILNAFHQVLVEYFLNDRQKLLEDLLKQDENLPLLLNNKSCQAVDSSGHCSSGSNKVVHDIVEFNNGNNTENVVYQNAHFNQEIQHVPEQPNSLYPPIYYCNQQIQSFVNGTNNLDRVKNSGNDDFTMSDIQTNQQIHASLSRTKHVDQDTSSENVDFAMRDIGTNQQTHGSIAQAIDYTIKRMNSSANGTNNIDQATSSENDDVNMGDIETNQQIHASLSGTKHVDQVTCSENGDVNMGEIETNRQIHAFLSGTKHVHQTTPSENVDFAMRDIGTNQQTHGSIAQAIDYTIKRMNSSANGTNNIDQATSSENDDVNMGDIETNQQIHASLSGTKHVHQTTPSENVDFTMRDIGTNQQTHDSIAQAIDYTIKRVSSSVNGTNNFDQARSCENDDVVMDDIGANQQIQASLSGTKHVDQVTCSENGDVNMGDIETNRQIHASLGGTKHVHQTTPSENVDFTMRDIGTNQQTHDSIAQAIDYTIKRINSSVNGTNNFDQARSCENDDVVMDDIRANQQIHASLSGTKHVDQVTCSENDDVNMGDIETNRQTQGSIAQAIDYTIKRMNSSVTGTDNIDQATSSENGDFTMSNIQINQQTCGSIDQSIVHQNMHDVLRSQGDDYFGNNGENCDSDRDPNNINWDVVYHNEHLYMHYEFPSHGDDHINENGENYYPDIDLEDMHAVHVIYHSNPHHVVHVLHSHRNDIVDDNGEYFVADGDNTNRNVNGFYRNDPQNAHRVSEGGDGHVVYNDEIFYNGDNAIIGANVIYQDEPQNMHQGFFVHGDGHVAENGEIQDADGAENEEEIVGVLVDEMGDAYSIPIGDHEEEMAEQLSEDDVDFQYAVHVQGNASRKRRRSSDDDDDRDEETRSPMCFKRRRLH